MRYLTLLFVLLFVSAGIYSQNSDKYVCRFGFTYEMSQHSSWGLNKPVVLSVSSLSPADVSGLKANDIIESINGVPTQNLMAQDINNLLLDNQEEQVILKVTNISYSNKEVSISKDCKLANAINEEQLSSAYSFYSLENSVVRSFECPFKTTIHQQSNFLNYKTFGFSAIDENNADIENHINQIIKSSLEKMGMTYKEQNPDILVNTYYSYNKNLNYSRSANADKLPTEFRYNMNTKKMEHLPIYFNPLINQKQAEYLLNFGIRFIDKNKTSKDNLFVIWECEANEMLQNNYSLEDYSRIHVPLILMQYPYPMNTEIARYKYSKNKYNYTGINFNIDDLKQIIDVDRMSPAYRAKLEPGDVVEKINDIKIEKDSKSASDAYKQFIFETMSLRDTKTQFTNAEGFTKCMFWDAFQYPKIADAFKNPKYMTGFSYLFYFESYINMSGTNILSFDIKRGGTKMNMKVTPIVRTEEIFEAY